MTPRLRTRVARAAAGTPEAGSSAAGAPRPAPAAKLAATAPVGLISIGTGAALSNSLPLLALPGALGNRATQQLLSSGLLSPRPGAGQRAGAFLVEDGAVPASGQMTRSAFLSELRSTLSAAADSAFAGTEHESRGCPWIEATLRFYERHDAARLERDLRTYAPDAATARDALVPIAERVRRSVATWVETGEITGLPPGLPGAGFARLLAGGRGEALTELLAKLGKGQPLASATRSRMERALGHRFGDVRVHLDDEAARLAQQHSARAFAVGRHVAFGAGEYRPGTPAGDVLLAHELAHVVQQSGARAPGATISSSGHTRLERDADRSALAAAATLWKARHELVAGLGGHTRPRLHTGLALQRCPAKQPERPKGSPFAPERGVGLLGQIRESTLAQESLGRYRANPGVYDPDYFVGVTVGLDQEQYLYDFSISALDMDQHCRGLDTAGCNQVSFMDTGPSLRAISPQQQLGTTTVRSPLELHVKAFSFRITVFVPRQTVATDITLEHELHHLADNYLVFRAFEDRAARAIRARVMSARREAAQHPDRFEALLGDAALRQIVTQVIDVFRPALAQEINYRSEVQHAGGEPRTPVESRPEFSENFVRPAAVSGARGTIARPQRTTSAASQGSTPQQPAQQQPAAPAQQPKP